MERNRRPWWEETTRETKLQIIKQGIRSQLDCVLTQSKVSDQGKVSITATTNNDVNATAAKDCIVAIKTKDAIIAVEGENLIGFIGANDGNIIIRRANDEIQGKCLGS